MVKNMVGFLALLAAVVCSVCRVTQSSVCDGMPPGNGVLPQSSGSPYFVDVESLFFVENIYLTVYLDAEDTAPALAGYYCQARTISNRIVGEFQVNANHTQGHSCGTQPDVFDTVSHSSSFRPGRSLVLRWRVNVPLSESVIIRCTFIQNSSTFWTDVESVEIEPIQRTSYQNCCSTEGVSTSCMPLCVNITESANEESLNLLLDVVHANSTCDYFHAQLALRCSHWSQPGYQVNRSTMRDCCLYQSISDNCMMFCNKNLFADLHYFPETNLTECFDDNPGLLDCILQPVQASEYIYATEETYTESTEDMTGTAIEYTDTSTAEFSGVTSSGSQSELPGRLVFTITTTVNVDGATQNSNLRNKIFTALETDLLIPALAKVPRYIQVRTGVDYREGSFVVESEGVYQQQNDGSVPSVEDVQEELQRRLQQINNTIRSGPEDWTLSRDIYVAYKAVNGQCETTSCDDGSICVEVGPSDTVCSCEDEDCTPDNSGLGTGAVIGIIVGVVVPLSVILGALLCMLKRRGHLASTKNAKNPQMSMRSNHSYEEPVYMDIASAERKPPQLPPDRNIATLPSNSVTYESPEEDKKAGEQSFRKVSEGYVVGVTADAKNNTKRKGDCGYATYDANQSNGKNHTSQNDYDDHHLKKGDYGYATYNVDESDGKDPTNRNEVEYDHLETGEYGYAISEVDNGDGNKYKSPDDYDDHHLKTVPEIVDESTGYTTASDVRSDISRTKQDVARYESLSGYEYSDSKPSM